jgi:hypothetical protein
MQRAGKEAAMDEISSAIPDIQVHRRFTGAAYNPPANVRSMVTEMSKLLSIFRRPRRASVRPVDPTANFSSRDWADLPVYHPATEDRR